MKHALFRGKPIGSDDWIYSYDVLRSHNWIDGKWVDRCWLQDGYSCNQMPNISDLIEVDVNTVGQFTKRYDQYNTEIYEGDKVLVSTSDYRQYIIEYHIRTTEFLARREDGGWSKIGLTTKIIGNIFE